MNFRPGLLRCALSAACGIMVSLKVAAQMPSQISVVDEFVRITFTSFKHAAMGRDGARAARLIDDETAALYEKMRVAALDAPKTELLKTMLFFQVAVLGIRHNFAKGDIQKINGREMYGKTVSAGGSSGAMGFEALSVFKVYPEKDGRSAFADLGIEGRSETFRIKFINNRGQWQIYLRELITIAGDELQGRFGISPTTPTDVVEDVIVKYLFPVIAEQSGRPVSADVWVPLAKRG